MSVKHFWWDNNLNRYIECSEEEAWAREEGNMSEDYTPGPVYAPPTKKLLTDTGTRFDHLNDLLDYFGEGLLAVTNSLLRHDNESDELRKKRLENTITLIQIYRDQLANVDGQKWDFNNMLDKCVPERGVLEAIRKENIERQKSGTD